MKKTLLKMYAVTPCHAGSGSALGVVDNPIQRERHTNWPVIQASGMKGAIRAHFDRNKYVLAGDNVDGITDRIFGSDKKETAGSMSVSDAKILAFPMRSNVSPFVWITCYSVLVRLLKDLKFMEMENLPNFSDFKLQESQAFVINGEFEKDDSVILEDMEVVCKENSDIGSLKNMFDETQRLLLVSDAVFDYGVSHCTQVMAQIKIDQNTGTTQTGSLRYQEELPADTLMYSIICWGDERSKEEKLKSEQIFSFFKDKVMPTHLQVGGDETMGRGIFELNWMEGGK